MKESTCPLGKKVPNHIKYDPNILYRISRIQGRSKFRASCYSFYGLDIWNIYELSWMQNDGYPRSAICTISYDCNSQYMIESKSLKLYINSLYNYTAKDEEEITGLLSNDLSNKLDTVVHVKIHHIGSPCIPMQTPEGICIDNIIYLNTSSNQQSKCDKVENEVIYTNLLRSKCPVTSQPDWATLVIKYTGQKINYQVLMKYIISLRDNETFHEHCIEKIFLSLVQKFHLSQVEVYGKYTRRGGIDINPFRTSLKGVPAHNFRTTRQ